MSVLVNDMLTLAGADSHTWSFHMEPAELDTLLLDSYEAFLPLAAKKEISLSVSLPEETLPACRCDAARISQLLAALLSNAITYGNTGGSVQLSHLLPHALFFPYGSRQWTGDSAGSGSAYF